MFSTMPQTSSTLRCRNRTLDHRPEPLRWWILATLAILLAFPMASAMAQSGSGSANKGRRAALGTSCGQCTGDLNDDGLLNELDLMVFEVYRAGFPQNLCADFDGDESVGENDRQYLKYLISESTGACNGACGGTMRNCFSEGEPGETGAEGCKDPRCCSVVCEIDPLCCSIVWDGGCVTVAERICRPDEPGTLPDIGNSFCEHEFRPPALDCVHRFDWQTYPGCSDLRCSTLVCSLDPACCRSDWDETCIDIARRQCQEPCTNESIRDYVCDQIPECCGVYDEVDGRFVTNWDADCTMAAAEWARIAPEGLNLQYFPSNGLLCDPLGDEGRPLDVQLETMQALVCKVLGEYCAPAGDGAFDANIGACLAVIERNYPGCIDLFADGDWDAACAQIADQLCRWPDAADIGLGDCLRSHDGGGCVDGYCTSVVCELDPACCASDWDAACVELAAIRCVLVPTPASGRVGVRVVGATSVRDENQFGCGSSSAGPCCYENFNAYCDDPACCQLVCSYDAYCCDVRWDEHCARLATDGCTLLADQCTCGPKLIQFGPPKRSCFEPRLLESQWQTGCADSDCCNAVCYVDPFCCEVRWDDICAEGAIQVCVEICYDQFGAPVPCYPECGDAFSGSCFVEHATGGCDDLQCCQNVCAIDPKCCDEFWDAPCVELAAVSCNECGDIYAGSCLAPNTTPACADAVCCNAVCDIDPYCCTNRWDSACASGAFGLEACAVADNCGSPTARGCFIASITPGCGDGDCCQLICDEYDSWCCEVRWDAICAEQAFAFCDPPVPGGTRDPCDVRHSNPGCNDPQCASAICSIAGFEYCCVNRWDDACVQAAQALCIGLYECPGPGDCKKSHSTPLCDDPSCCNAVCTYDPTCCRIQWDSECATLAILTCRVPSGVDWPCPCEGDCFSARDEDDPRPGCEDGSCCAVVCRIDELCCTETWDERCVTIASFYCGSDPTCGASSAGSCLELSDTPFCDDAACCYSVCTIDPICCSDRWDSFCVSLAQDRCRRGCGIESAGSCFFPHLNPGCSDAECCSTVCEKDPICCTTIWDGTCAEEALEFCVVPACGDFPAGSCCEANLTPACNDRRCCDAVCAVDSFCCDTTWDLECVRMARQEIRCGCGANWDCGDPCAGECCEANFTPKCNDSACCNAVCDIDSYCCDVEWDVVCAIGALGTDGCTGPDDACPAPQCGDADAGDCCFTNGTPSCNDITCCNRICASDPICCEDSWDAICASAAATECDVCSGGLTCGDPDAGDCLVPNETPYCNDATCCNLVCEVEYFCCIGSWDEYCAALAVSLNCDG